MGDTNRFFWHYMSINNEVSEKRIKLECLLQEYTSLNYDATGTTFTIKLASVLKLPILYLLRFPLKLLHLTSL